MIRFAKPNIRVNMDMLMHINNILESGWVASGIWVNKLEEYFRNTYKVKHAIACSSATQGLVIAVKALGIKNMDVAIPAFTWPSTEYATLCNGNRTVYSDVNKETWLMWPPSTKYDAAIFVDTFGNQSPNWYTGGLPKIYDAAHGFGLPNLGKRGDIEVVSFSFTKIVTGMQGGIILTDRDDVIEDIRELTQLSAKMCEVNALIALQQIKEYGEKCKVRDRLIETYRSLLSIPFVEQKTDTFTNYSVYAILVENRDRIADKLKDNNFEVKVYYEPLYRGLPNTEFIYSRIIALPIYSEVEERIPQICEIINKCG